MNKNIKQRYHGVQEKEIFELKKNKIKLLVNEFMGKISGEAQ